MALNRKAVLVGLVVCVAGAWLIFRPTAVDTSAAGVIAGEPSAGEPPASDREDRISSSSVDPSDGDGDGDGDGGSSDEAESDGRDQPGSNTPSGTELEDLTLETLPTATTMVEFDTDCDSGYAGLGVEMRAWGDVLLPYTPGYPTTEPGEVWDCTAGTAFGAAIAMTHAAYLEALRPDVIPAIALDSPGRDIRVNGHVGSNLSASLGFRCSPIGWNWDGDDTWSLLHQCGEGELRVSYYPMEFRNGRWWLVYPEDGEIDTGPPPEDYAYYAFIGGD
ncbi:MAG: hypothetical protein OER95_06380 [Acidimicrobiia bacterium]|nr:hypothetical protein [Acidimicrobiia bacterium]